ncbi:glyoxalase superfamily protein [Duganella sp. sic0402]|uniref:glyoxalase superfamily protein n=1 Tax=Duganella sp. sic0402 TaxID=2854786 RepID=UPI0035A2F05E
MAKQYKHARPGVEEVPWGGRAMTIKDTAGNHLVFYQASQNPRLSAMVTAWVRSRARSLARMLFI